MLTGFPLSERDRRWAAVRSLMQSAGMTLLVLTDPASIRYLTQVDDPTGAAVFPADGEPTLFLGPRGEAPSTPSWVGDLRPEPNGWTRSLIEHLRDLGADRAIVGLTGLDPMQEAPEGYLNYNAFVGMREWLSHARWVGARMLVREVADVKSEEEIAILEQTVRLAEDALAAALSDPAGASSRNQARARALATLTLHGADAASEITLSRAPQDHATDRPFAEADLLDLAISARLGGYCAPLVQPICVGKPSVATDVAWNMLANEWRRVWSALRVGQPLQEVIGPRTDGACQIGLAIAGAGLGDDLPWSIPGRSPMPAMAGPELRVGEVFTVRTSAAWTEEDQERTLTWGESIVMTTAGPRRLGTRPHALQIWN